MSAGNGGSGQPHGPSRGGVRGFPWSGSSQRHTETRLAIDVPIFGAGSLRSRRSLEPDIDAVAVRGESFLVRQEPDVGGDPLKPVAVDVDQARPLEEIFLVKIRRPP